MSVDLQSNKRIAKNALMLYIRMFLVLGVSLYTSRVVLQVLGVEDYGLYNVIGGVIILFSFINNAMIASTQRFLNFELGRNNQIEASKIFSASLSIHILIALIVLFLAETVGLWFLNTYIQIPENKEFSAFWVYQFSIIAFIINIVRAPYNACIIAHEKMSFFAYISVLEVILKLIIVYALYLFSTRIIAYAALVFVVTFLIGFVYIIYCRIYFDICKYKFEYDKKRFFSLTSFSGWSLFGSVANVGSQQGINIILNMFFGVLLNAAMGVANQVNNAIYQFVSNFQMAFNPQITKLYAAGKSSQFLDLVLNSSRYSFYLLFIVAMPIAICCEDVLDVWLVDVPEYSVIFCQLMIVSSIFDTLSGPLWASVYASGNLKRYQLSISILLFSILIVSYLIAKLGMSPIWVLSVKPIMNLFIYLYRLLYCCTHLNLSFKEYANKVLLRCMLIVLVTTSLLYLFYLLGGVDIFIIELLIVFLTTVFTILIFGLTHSEKKYIKTIIQERLCKRSQH